MKKPLFHELTDAEWERMKSDGWTWGQVEETFEQPPWCAYPGALDGMMGCWSLVGRLVRGEAKCKGCDCHRNAPRAHGQARHGVQPPRVTQPQGAWPPQRT